MFHIIDNIIWIPIIKIIFLTWILEKHVLFLLWQIHSVDGLNFALKKMVHLWKKNNPNEVICFLIHLILKYTLHDFESLLYSKSFDVYSKSCYVYSLSFWIYITRYWKKAHFPCHITAVMTSRNYRRQV